MDMTAVARPGKTNKATKRNTITVFNVCDAQNEGGGLDLQSSTKTRVWPMPVVGRDVSLGPVK
jgi:hypothetical protein